MPHRQGFSELYEKTFGKERVVYGIEIGCFEGQFSSYLLSKFPELYLTTIDPYLKWDEVLHNTKSLQSRFQILPVSSNVGFKLLDRKFDFVFIDGDHSYEQCKLDIINYAPLIKDGGLVSGHNYHKAPSSAHPGVHQAVDEIYGDKVKLAEDFIWYVQI